MLAFINATNLNELFKWITIVSIILAAVAVLGKLIIMMRSSKTSKKEGNGYYSEQQPDFIDEKTTSKITYGANSQTSHNDNAKIISDNSDRAKDGELVFGDEDIASGKKAFECKKKAVADASRSLEKGVKKDAKYSAKKTAKELINKMKK